MKKLFSLLLILACMMSFSLYGQKKSQNSLKDIAQNVRKEKCKNSKDFIDEIRSKNSDYAEKILDTIITAKKSAPDITLITKALANFISYTITEAVNNERSVDGYESSEDYSVKDLSLFTSSSSLKVSQIKLSHFCISESDEKTDKARCMIAFSIKKGENTIYSEIIREENEKATFHIDTDLTLVKLLNVLKQNGLLVSVSHYAEDEENKSALILIKQIP